MKTIQQSVKLLVLAAGLFSASAGFAQTPDQPAQHNPQHRKQMAEQRMQELSARLSLRPEQQARLKDIMKQNREEMKALRESKKDAPKEEKRTAMIAQMKKADENINAILDTKQQELYKQYKAEKKAERKNRGPRGEGSPGIDHDDMF